DQDISAAIDPADILFSCQSARTQDRPPGFGAYRAHPGLRPAVEPIERSRRVFFRWLVSLGVLFWLSGARQAGIAFPRRNMRGPGVDYPRDQRGPGFFLRYSVSARVASASTLLLFNRDRFSRGARYRYCLPDEHDRRS